MIGTLGFSYRQGWWLADAIRFFTSSKISHCFVGFCDIFGQPSVIEAYERVRVVPFSKFYAKHPEERYYLFRPTKATAGEIELALAEVYSSLSGEIYGFMQLLWFMWFALKKWLGLPERGSNWFPNGVICSEVMWRYLKALGGQYSDLLGKTEPNSVSAQFFFELCETRKDLFELVEKKWES